jgi:hypothetical protein
MRQGQSVDKEVTLRNAGSGPLCVSGVTTGCGCVRATLLGDRRIPPGGTGIVQVTVDVGRNRQGPQSKEVRVFTNDPDRRTASFRVLADVRLGVILMDSVAQFGRTMKSRPATASVRLKSPRTEPPWEVTALKGSHAAYSFVAEEIASTEPDFRVLQLRIQHPGSDRTGPNVDTIKLQTSHAEHREILIQAHLMVVDRYFAAPPEFPFGLMEPDKVGHWYQVRLLSGEPNTSVPFAGVRVEGKAFEAGEASPAGSGEWTVPLRVDTHGLTPGRTNATLVVSLDDPDVKEIRVPLWVEVIAPGSRPGRVPGEPVSSKQR